MRRRGKKKTDTHGQRIVRILPQVQPSGTNFPSNAIRTSKYTPLTFFPFNLWEQFQRLANVYFLIISILQFLPVSSMTPTSWLPLVFVLTVNMVKEAVEDTRRKKMDAEVNQRSVCRIGSNGAQDIHWRDVVVGDVVYLKEDQHVPADIVVLTSSDTQSGVCYIETANLDGETNLKDKEALEATHTTVHDSGLTDGGQPPPTVIQYLGGLQIECEKPNANLHSFTGTLTSQDQPGVKMAIVNKQVIYRGCTLRNSNWIYGVVVFTGMDTKLMMNATEKRFKRTTLDKKTNKYLIGVFICLGLLCIGGGLLSGWWLSTHNNPSPWYLYDVGTFAPDALLTMITWLILLNSLIPISLTVSMEMIKVGHAYFINQDATMVYEDPLTGVVTPARARTSNLSEDLGRIEYIFSDKTGTLTQNVMEFMKCCIDGESYGQGTTEIGRAGALREGTLVEEVERPADLVLEPGDNFYDTRVSQGAWKEQPNADSLKHFFIHLAVCHKVMAKPKEGDTEDESSWTRENISYQASSPDEAALVIGAKGSGFWFKRRLYSDVVLEVDEEELTYKVLNVNEFNSTRKRMSTVVRTPENTLMLFCKGADNVMYERLSSSSQHQEETKECLRKFANEGLRTLVLGKRELSEAEYETWNQTYMDAFTATQDRDDLLDQVAEDIEKDMILCGASAIEDKLQEGVPYCIAQLAKANIQIWVLTGDKVETAINIAMACNLIDSTMHNEKVTLPDLPTAADMNAVHHQRKQQVLQQLQTAIHQHEKGMITAEHTALVIDGYSLEYAIAHEGESKSAGLLLKLSALCKAVVCCRVSPKQKADIVEMMRSKRNVITLAIGDGANDVGMITKAHIGVGISGKEGVQAVMASDYAVAQFRYLQQLVLIHGRWDYQRISLVILYFFYKNLAFAMVIYWFAFYNGFSGTAFWDDMFQAVWNVFFTSIPIMAVAMFNRDMRWQATLHYYPHLYYDVQCGKDFTSRRFIIWMVEGMWCSLVCFFVPRFAVYSGASGGPDGVQEDKWFLSATCFAAVHMACNLRLCLNTRTWPWPTVVVTLLSLSSYYIFGLIWTSFPLTLAKEGWLMMIPTLGRPLFWFSLILAVVLAITPAFVVLALKQAFKPDNSMATAAWEKDVTTRKRWGKNKHQHPIKSEKEMSDYLQSLNDGTTPYYPPNNDNNTTSYPTTVSNSQSFSGGVTATTYGGGTTTYGDGGGGGGHGAFHNPHASAAAASAAHGPTFQNADGVGEEYLGYGFSYSRWGDPEVRSNAYVPNVRVGQSSSYHTPSYQYPPQDNTMHPINLTSADGLPPPATAIIPVHPTYTTQTKDLGYESSVAYAQGYSSDSTNFQSHTTTTHLLNHNGYTQQQHPHSSYEQAALQDYNNYFQADYQYDDQYYYDQQSSPQYYYDGQHYDHINYHDYNSHQYR